MSEPAQAGKTCDLRGIREAVCVHTGKITDSCLAKDCIEDLRVYLTVGSQQTLRLRGECESAVCGTALYPGTSGARPLLLRLLYGRRHVLLSRYCRHDALGRAHKHGYRPCCIFKAAGAVRRGNERSPFSPAVTI